tara:strand:+ start:386 stop:577 length:192 start_codon:yes stop_codon:yes gene_type:complete
MRGKNIGEQVKTEIVENILNSKAVKIGKYTVFGLGAIYALGFVFKVLAFTKTNLNEFRRSLKP